jgi:hypothetical protein
MTVRFGDVVRYSEKSLEWCRSDEMRTKLEAWRGVVLQVGDGHVMTEDGQEFQPWEVVAGDKPEGAEVLP